VSPGHRPFRIVFSDPPVQTESIAAGGVVTDWIPILVVWFGGVCRESVRFSKSRY